MKHSLIIVLVLVVCSTIFAGDFTVVNDKQQAKIVFNSKGKDYEVKAYQELAQYLEKATGKKFETIAEDKLAKDEKAPLIFVGDCQATQKAIGSKLAKLDRDAYMVVVKSDNAYLAGPRDWSTYWAVCEFLEDYAGVRWLIPGPLGEDILPVKKIEIKQITKEYKPAVLSREWSLNGNRAYADQGRTDWAMRQRINPRYRFSHNFHKLFDPAKYYDKHPEYYQLRDGKRIRPDNSNARWNPCLSNPDVMDVAAQAACDHFSQNPDEETFNFGPNDGFSDLCECPQCKFLQQPDRKFHEFRADLSRPFFTWLSKVVTKINQKCPGKMIGALAYSYYLTPPDKGDVADMPRNIIPYMPLVFADIYSPGYRKAAEEVVKLWAQRVDQIALYDYAYGVGVVMPRIYVPLEQEFIQYALKYKLKGLYAEEYANWGLDAPRIYQTAKIWWDPFVKTEPIFNEWCDRMFRESAEPMKKYFSRCQQQWLESKEYSKWEITMGNLFIFLRTHQFEIYPPSVIAELTAYLDDAAKTAKSDTTKQRIQFFRKTWDSGVVFAQAYWAGEGAQSLINKGATLKEVVAALKNMPPTYNKDYFLNEINTRLDDDRVAYFEAGQKTGHYMTPFPKEVSEQTLKWCAKQVYDEVDKQRVVLSIFDDNAMRKVLKEEVGKIFGKEGSPKYQETVAQIEKYAVEMVK